MCKLIIATNTKDNNKPFEQMVKIQIPTLAKEPHGIGAFVIDKERRVKVFRSVNNYAEVFDQVKAELGTARLVGLHTRTKTTGEVNLENVHFFEVNGQMMAHNGWIPKYGTRAWSSNTPRYDGHSSSGVTSAYFKSRELIPAFGALEFNGENLVSPSYEKMCEVLANCKGCNEPMNVKGYCKKHKKIFESVNSYDPTQPALSDEDGITDLGFSLGSRPRKTENVCEDFSDSYQFTRDLKKDYTKKDIEDLIEEKSFSGMAFLMDVKTLRSHMLVHKDSYVIQGKDYSGFFSYTPETEYSSSKWGWINGIPYKKGTTTLKLKGSCYQLARGTYEMEIEPLFEQATVELASTSKK